MLHFGQIEENLKRRMLHFGQIEEMSNWRLAMLIFIFGQNAVRFIRLEFWQETFTNLSKARLSLSEPYALKYW